MHAGGWAVLEIALNFLCALLLLLSLDQLLRRAWPQTGPAAEFKGSVAERPYYSIFSDQNSVEILSEFRKVPQNSSEILNLFQELNFLVAHTLTTAPK